MNYSVYEDIIMTRMIWQLIFGCAMFVALVVATFLLFRNMRENRVVFCLLCIVAFLGLIVDVWLTGTTVYESLHDIKNQAYVVWDGDFTVYQNRSTNVWYLPDKGGIKLEGEGMSQGKYTGQVIYGEKTRIVLEYHITEDN